MLSLNRQKKLILAVVALCLAIPMVDMSVTALALPSIKKVIFLKGISIQWVINAYILSMATFGIISGKLSDIFNPKKIILLGLFIFLFASIGSFFSKNFIDLLFFRAIQGMSGALLGAPAIKFLADGTNKDFLSKAMGITTGFAAISLIISPLLTGQILKYLTWNYIFLINIPLVIIAILCLLKIKIDHNFNENIKINISSFLFISLFLFCIVFMIMEGLSNLSNNTSKFVLIILAISSFILFIKCEYKNSNPIIKTELFRNIYFIASCLIIMIIQIQALSAIFWIMYLQICLHYTAEVTSFLFLPFYLLIIGSGFASGLIMNKKGPFLLLLISSSILFLGYLFTITLLPMKTYLSLIPVIISGSITFYFFLNTTRFITIDNVESCNQGIALGILSNFRQIAGTIGLAIFSRIISSSIGKENISSNAYEVNFYNGFSEILKISVSLSIMLIMISVIIYLKNKKSLIEHVTYK